MKKFPPHIASREAKEPKRQALLSILKLRGELTISELCQALEVTQTAVRRCIFSLQAEGMIASSIFHKGRGRPAYKYRLTEQAASFFPSGYQSLAEEFLDTIFENGGHKEVMDFLKANNDRVSALLTPSFADKNFAQKVDILSRYFVERGYMTDFLALSDGNFFLFHQNCAVYKIASRYRQICILEPRLIARLLGVKISRQQYILKNQPVCGYLIDSSCPLLESRPDASVQ